MIHIVMMTRNRHQLTSQAIVSLYKNTPQSMFSLTVVDDCSEDREPLFKLQRGFGFELLLNDVQLPTGASKNKGLKDKDGFVYISDNDVYFHPGWLSYLGRAWSLKPNDIKVLGGGCHKYLGTNKRTIIHGVEFHYKDALSGWSWLLRHETWKEFGPFEENALGTGQSEDWAFCQRVKQAGYEVASIWPEVVTHCGRTNTEGKPATGSETIVDVPGLLIQ